MIVHVHHIPARDPWRWRWSWLRLQWRVHEDVEYTFTSGKFMYGIEPGVEEMFR